MLQRARGLCTALVFAGSTLAQTTFEVGWQDLYVSNPTGSGSAQIPVRVYYPATARGLNTLLVPMAGGWPVYVFLHGAGSGSRHYEQPSVEVARHGCVIVLPDTGQYDSNLLQRDGAALYRSLSDESQRQGSPLRGVIDMNRAAIGGYSMGGGAALRVVAQNPGYRAAFAHAPTSGNSSGPAVGPSIQVPVGLVVGLGDTTVGWSSVVNGWYANLRNVSGLRVTYLMNQDASHVNVIDTPDPSTTTREVYARSMRVANGFLAAVLKGDVRGLDAVVGDTARGEARLVQLYNEVEQPALWYQGGTTPGSRGTLTGYSAGPVLPLMVAAGTGAIATPFGTLLLDPYTLVVVGAPPIGQDRLARLTIDVPNDPSLAGKTFWFQALGQSSSGIPRLTTLQPIRL